MTPEILRQLRCVQGTLFADQMKRAAPPQRREDHRLAGIHGQRLQHRVAATCAEIEPLRHRPHILDKLPMLDQHTFGQTRGA